MPKNNAGWIHIGKFYDVADITLGQGSFSKVYLARHKVFGNFVALKVIDKNKIQEEYVSKNLTREASILRKLKHPNIVNFYEEFSHDQLYCLSMELVDGCDLSHFLNKQQSRKVSEKFAKILFFQMVSAINYMHKAHVLHRDLKQENILLESKRVIKIVDFGLSNTYYPHTHLRTHCGSLEYAAPELFVHKSFYGAGVDLWSLGVILYSMVTGRMPFAVPKKADGAFSTSHREKFHKRISLGLTAENWKELGNLSYDCCNLIENLLQPNQYRRLQIRDAYIHPWLQKDGDLKKSLPQHRPDLMRRFKPEIIDWMADRLCVSGKRVQNHLATYRYDSISAIYYMVQDTLIKEVLYPTADLKRSLLFRLNNWRRTIVYGTFEQHEELSPRVGHREAPVSQGFETDQPSHISETNEACGSGCLQQKGDDGLVSVKPKEKGPRNVVDIRNRVGDGGHLDRTPKEKLSVSKSNCAFSKQEANLVLKKDVLKGSQQPGDQSSTLTNTNCEKLTVKVKNVSEDIVVEVVNGLYKVCEEKHKDKDPFDADTNLDHALKSSVDYNYQRNLKLLNEKYGLKYQQVSKSTKPANRAEIQRRPDCKRKPLNEKHEPNDAFTKGNGCRNTRASINSNTASKYSNNGNDLMEIYKSEVGRKGNYRHKQKFTTKEDSKVSKVSEQIPASKNCPKHLSSFQNPLHKQRYVNFNGAANTVNSHYTNKKGLNNLRLDPIPSYGQIHRYTNEFKKKPKFDHTLANKKSSSRIQVDVPQKSVLTERKEG